MLRLKSLGPPGDLLKEISFIRSLLRTPDKLQGDCPHRDVAKSLVTAPCNFPIQSCVTEVATLRSESILLLCVLCVLVIKLCGNIIRSDTSMDKYIQYEFLIIMIGDNYIYLAIIFFLHFFQYFTRKIFVNHC